MPQDAQIDGNISAPTIEAYSDEPDMHTEHTQEKRGFAFWCIIIALSWQAFLSSLEGTLVLYCFTHDSCKTRWKGLLQLERKWILPHKMSGNFILLDWRILNMIYSMVFQPLYGRRWLMIFATTIFIIGSAACGASQNIFSLIAGRAIQGVGGGGLNMLTNLIVSDIVPLRERGNFMAYLVAAVIVRPSTRPFISGTIVQIISWRLIFWINLPICGLA